MNYTIYGILMGSATLLNELRNLPSLSGSTMPFDLTVRMRSRQHFVRAAAENRGFAPDCFPKQHQTGRFVPEKSNIWRDCVDGYYDWVKEHIAEARACACSCHRGVRQ